MSWNVQLSGEDAGMAIAVILAGYLFGCFATGYYLVKWKTGQDIRKIGSGNIGARNAGRALGRFGFLLTLIGDFAKGTLAVWFAYLLTNAAHYELLALVAVVAGHMWPFQLGFRGGKGISTSIGGLLLFPSILGCFFVIMAVALALLRKTTLAGMVAYLLVPAACFFLKLDGAYILAVSLLAGLILFAHRRNVVEDISNLISRPSLSAKANSSDKEI